MIGLWASGFGLWGGLVARLSAIRTAAALAAALVLAIAAPVAAQVTELPMPERSTAANQKPGILQNIGIDQKIGQQLPLDLMFKDETGRDVRLGEYFGKRPVVLALAYYDCPMLCTQVLNGMTGALKTLSLDAGTDFDVVVVSIDPQDSFRVAALKKRNYVEHYGRPQTAAGWHFLTGAESSIKPLASAIGFRYAYDYNLKQYAHGAAIYVVTPKGVVARYLMGIDFAPRDLRLSLVEASNNVLGTISDKVLLLCYHYDPATGQYGAATLNAVRVGFIATVAGFLTFLFVSLRSERRAAARRVDEHEAGLATRI